MKIMDRIFGRNKAIEPETRSLENPSVDIVRSLVGDIGYGNNNSIRVNQNNALTSSVVYTCIRVLAEEFAALPFNVYKRIDGGGKIVDRTHKLYKTLHISPNIYSTSYVFRELMIVQSCIFNKAVALIYRDGSRTSLINIHPELVKIEYIDGQKKFLIKNQSAGYDVFDDSEIIYIPGLSLDGNKTISPVLEAGRKAISLALETQEYTSTFFSNGARPSGLLTTKTPLSAEGRLRIKEAWEKAQGGLSNTYKTAVLDSELSYQSLSTDADKSQLIETRRFQVEDICRFFRIPPVFAGDYSRSTYANVEQQDLHFSKHCILPLTVKFEQEFNRKLFNDDEESFCEFNLDGLQRGDFETRINGFARGIQTSIFTPNEVRSMMNMPPMEGGDKLYIQGATVELTDTTKQQDNPNSGVSADEQQNS